MKLELVTLCLMVGAALAQQVPQYRPYQNYPQYRQFQNNPLYQNNDPLYQAQYRQQQALQYQQYQQRGAVAVPILQYSNDVNPDGSFQYSYQTADGIAAQAAGYTRNLGLGARGVDAEAQVVQGSYSYTGPDGVVYTVNYVADENGYRAEGAHLPTPSAQAKALPYYQQPTSVLAPQAYQQQPFQTRSFQRRF